MSVGLRRSRRAIDGHFGDGLGHEISPQREGWGKGGLGVRVGQFDGGAWCFDFEIWLWFGDAILSVMFVLRFHFYSHRYLVDIYRRCFVHFSLVVY